MASTITDTSRSDLAGGPDTVIVNRPRIQRGTIGPLLGRLLICPIFLLSGVEKFMQWQGTQGYMKAEFERFFGASGIVSELSSFLISAIPLLLAVAAIIEIIGGLCLLLGYRTRTAAFVLFLFMIPTTLIFHSFWTMPEAQQQIQTIMFMKNLCILGGLALLISFGPGRISLDAQYRRREVHVVEA